MVLLRAPRDIAARLHHLIREGAGRESIDIEWWVREDPATHAVKHELRIDDDDPLEAELVELPTVIECHKTRNHTSYYKAGYVSHMLVVKDADTTVSKDSGITPPTAHIVRRRFAKTTLGKLSTFEDNELREAYSLLKQAVASAGSTTMSLRWFRTEEVPMEERMEEWPDVWEEHYVDGVLYDAKAIEAKRPDQAMSLRATGAAAMAADEEEEGGGEGEEIGDEGAAGGEGDSSISVLCANDAEAGGAGGGAGGGSEASPERSASERTKRIADLMAQRSSKGERLTKLSGNLKGVEATLRRTANPSLRGQWEKQYRVADLRQEVAALTSEVQALDKEIVELSSGAPGRGAAGGSA